MGAFLPLVALTAGEPAGIGPDLCALLAPEKFPGRLVIVGDRRVIAARAMARGVAFDIATYRDRDSAPAISMLDIPAPAPVTPGRLIYTRGGSDVCLVVCAPSVDRTRERRGPAMVGQQPSHHDHALLAF